MAEIFISYKSERRAAAAHLAKILERYGYTVWFDYHLVKGDDFADEIDRRIREAKALVVLWCKLAVQSVWVRREAALADAARHSGAGHDRALRTARGLRQRRLHRPFRLERRAAATASSFPLLDGIAHRVGRPPRLDFMAMREYEEDWHRFGAPSLKAFALDAPVSGASRRSRLFAPREPNPPSPAMAVATRISPTTHHGPAEHDWKLIENSTDPRDFRAFIEEHKSGLLVRKAQHKLEDLADEALATAPAPTRPRWSAF